MAFDWKGGKAYDGGGPTLQLGFDAPWERRAVLGCEDDVCDEGVDVFGVDEEAVHVEEACADGGEASEG